MTYEQWDKISPVNGIEAVDLIGQEQMENDDPFVLYKDGAGNIIAIESVATMKVVYGLTGEAVGDVAAAYIAFKATEKPPANPEDRITALEEENAALKTTLDDLILNQGADVEALKMAVDDLILNGGVL